MRNSLKNVTSLPPRRVYQAQINCYWLLINNFGLSVPRGWPMSIQVIHYAYWSCLLWLSDWMRINWPNDLDNTACLSLIVACRHYRLWPVSVQCLLTPGGCWVWWWLTLRGDTLQSINITMTHLTPPCPHLGEGILMIMTMLWTEIEIAILDSGLWLKFKCHCMQFSVALCEVVLSLSQISVGFQKCSDYTIDTRDKDTFLLSVM